MVEIYKKEIYVQVFQKSIKLPLNVVHAIFVHNCYVQTHAGETERTLFSMQWDTSAQLFEFYKDFEDSEWKKDKEYVENRCIYARI